jgi:threonine dehydrogenase-like Zn-dependent dehydrogenase
MRKGTVFHLGVVETGEAFHFALPGVNGRRVRFPRPGPGEIRLRLRWAGLCGTDLVKLSRGTAAPGTVLGHEREKPQ